MSDRAIMTSKNNFAPQEPQKIKNMWVVFLIGIIVIFTFFAGAYKFLEEQRLDKELDLQQQQVSVLIGRAESIQSWLGGMVDLSKRLVGSDIFMLFASEMNDLPEGMPLLFSDPRADIASKGEVVDQLYSQVPLMKNMLSEFAKFGEFTEAQIMTSRGEAYLSTSTVNPVTAEQIAFAKEVVKSGQIVYGPLTAKQLGIILFDIYIPIFPPQEGLTTPAAVLVLTVNAYGKINELFSPGAFRNRALNIELVQKNGSAYQYYRKDMGIFMDVPNFTLNEKQEVPFGIYGNFEGSGSSYISGLKAPTLDWWIIAANSEGAVTKPMRQLSNVSYSVAGLISSVLLLCMLAGWWWLIGRRQYAINKKFRSLLVTIEDQKKLLDGINNTISDPITLTDAKGVFVYVNKAFSNAVGRTEEECVGLDGPAVFGFDTAKRLNVSDQNVLMSGDTLTISEILWLQSKRYDFQISKAALKDANTRTSQGIVSVYRDMTELVETEKRSHRMVLQTIDALVRAIEEVDPFLGGHSRIMGSIATLIAKQLNLKEREVGTIEAAATLSQIGKMFVPREILLKPGALTPEEKQAMEQHVVHAQKVLSGIEFELPVLEAIMQMNERLDGTGYPHKLKGDAISTDARVIAVANAFAAMARPRSYRQAMPIEQVLGIMEQDAGSVFDPAVVTALREVLNSPAGQRIVALAAATRAV